MKEIVCNITKNSIELNQSYKRRKNQRKPDYQVLENKFWIFLKDIGYSSLNSDPECEIVYSNTKRKVDIVAECERSRLFIECTIEDSKTKIDATIGKFNSYKQHISLLKKDTAQIYFTNQDINKNNLKLLEDAEIRFINEKTLDYFIQLQKGNKDLAYSQFLHFIFEGKIIRSLDKEEYKIPAIKAKDNMGDYYIFSVHPSLLLPISTVPHRKAKSGNEVSKSYQRLIDSNKIGNIKNYIRKDNSFPTNLIVNINHKKFIKDFQKSKGDMGILTIEPRYGLISIIDGQHRLLSYINENEAEKHYVTVTAYVDLEIKQQIKTFVTINEEQKPVSKNLIWDLYPELYSEDDLQNGYKVQLSNFCKKLNEEDKSFALYRLIKYPSSPRSKSGRKSINLNAICTTLLNSGLAYKKPTKTNIPGKLVVSLIEKYDVKENKIEEIMLDLVKTFFNTSKEISFLKNKWENKFYKTDLYIGSYLLLLKSIFIHITENTKELKELKDLSRLFKMYLSPAQKYIDNMDPEKIKEFKGGNLGGGGPKGVWEDLIIQINSKYPDFEKDQIKNRKVRNEFAGYLKELEESGEDQELEAKQSFFVDVSRLNKEEKYSKNEKMTSDIIKSIVGFANGGGGSVLIGVGDPKNHQGEWKVTGIEDSDLSKQYKYYEKGCSFEKYRKAIIQTISSVVDNGNVLKSRVNISVFNHDDHLVSIISVSKISKLDLENQKLISLDNIAYKRENDEKLPILPNDVKNYCSEKLIELYTENKDTVEFDDVTKTRILDAYMPKSCPKCEKKANNWKELIDKFGLRFSNEKHIPQSQCRKCRNSS